FGDDAREHCSSARRGAFAPDFRSYNLGFRVVRAVTKRAGPAAKATLTNGLKNGLIAYYPFNGNAKDESGNGNHGKVEGPRLSVDRFGQQDACYAFDGRDDRILAGSTDWPGGNRDRTVSVWFKAEPVSTPFANLFSMGDGNQAGRRFSLVLTPSPNRLYFSGQYRDQGFEAVYAYQVWNHAVLLLRGGVTETYINGNHVNSFRPRPPLDTDGKLAFVIGAGTVTRNDEFFPGSLDDVRVYNRALAADEVKALYEYDRREYRAGNASREVIVQQLSSRSDWHDVRLNQTAITDNDIAVLAQAVSLRHLNLDNTQVTDAGLVHLKDLANLQTLNLRNTQVTDAGLVQLKDLAKLQDLDLSKTAVTDVGVARLRPLINLEGLNLSETKITGNALGALAALPRLQRLAIQECHVGDEAVKKISLLRQLQVLNLMAISMSDAAIEPLSSLTELRVLHIGWNPITGATLHHLRRCSKLEMLTIPKTQVRDAHLSSLSDLKALGYLRADINRITGKGLGGLRGLPALHSLDLGPNRIDDAGLMHLDPQQMPQLRELSLEENPLTDAVIPHLAKFSNLAVVNLSETQVTQAGITRLRQLLPRVKIHWKAPQ
ncbi:MAG: hypothetical protein MK136_17860, partial [Pirellulaceae bacterium]|nr:hypothetical protein [Pirellulaceae bacterium]